MHHFFVVHPARLSERQEAIARARQLMPDVILKEIAAALAIAESTVKNHMRTLLEKPHMENRV